MRKSALWILFLCLPFWVHSAEGKADKKIRGRGREVQIRLAPQFGVLGRQNQAVLNRAFKKFILVLPEGNISWQLTPKWFASFSFTYARWRDKAFFNALGVRQKGHANIYGPTLGVRIVSSTDEPSEGDFFDDARWWFALEFGPYFTRIQSPILGPNRDVDFGFNFGGGFDYFFHRTFAVGLQTKFHYVNYSPDDYFLFSFGPHITAKF